MKAHLLLPVLIAPLGVVAQNLVIDPSFEAHTTCPDWASQIERCSHWTSPDRATTDYYNSCSSAFASYVPFNMAGKQWPHSGNAYVGIVTRVNSLRYSERVQGRLSEPLIKGAYYKVSYYASLAGISKYVDGDLGAFFSEDSLYGAYCLTPAPDPAQVVKSLCVPEFKDVDSWQLVTGLYQASGGESFVILGNVAGAQSKLRKNKIVRPQVNDDLSYYYIDDVTVVRALDQHDTAFDRTETRSEHELSVGPALTIAPCNAVFEQGTSALLDLSSINEQAQQDTGYVPAFAMLGYVANFMIENPAVYLEIGVRHPRVENTEAVVVLTRARAVAVLGLLADMGVSPERMSIVGHGMEAPQDPAAMMATTENDGVIEMRIAEIDEAPRSSIRYVQVPASKR